MSQLTQAYRAARAADGRDATDSPALEPTLAALCARGRAAHPDLGLDALAFVAHLARCGAPIADGPGPVHAEDLYAACAALTRGANVAAALRRAHRTAIAAYLGAIDGPRPTLDEIEQRLWDVLL